MVVVEIEKPELIFGFFLGPDSGRRAGGRPTTFGEEAHAVLAGRPRGDGEDVGGRLVGRTSRTTIVRSHSITLFLLLQSWHFWGFIKLT